jgi:hypothetical protein
MSVMSANGHYIWKVKNEGLEMQVSVKASAGMCKEL